MSLTYLDLFSGAGGLSLGFDYAGFRQLLSIELEPEYCETYRVNFPHHRVLQQDLTKLSNEQLLTELKDQTVDVVIGGPPCQGFSMAGHIGRTFTDDPRNYLFREFVRVVNIVKPRFFVMENVARLYSHNSGKTRTEIINCFNEIGYSVECQILNAVNFGVAQQRSRVVFIGRKDKGKIVFPEKKQGSFKTVGEVIGHFPILQSGERHELIANHEAMKHTSQMLEKMSFVQNGGNRSDIPKSLRPKTGDVRKYIRYHRDKPSVCVTGDMRKVFHYEQNRALTVRELAALQSFPDDFVFCGKKIAQQQQVGNAVPPLLAEAIAKSILQMSQDG
ncbi:DNA cytosine methyltransferase [Haemophilus influenzae]|uniref:DNA cytosine methyltransferase n=1 Tax=Haemophilus influenzae TaxID=727 RepID=UPI000D014D6B|nr:DNA (cytosine-5-)-methyltransferase [Haemophilus influenzae]PRL63581.1 Modification methylase HaeIII [Haemophilus influenzae]PRL63732.1 Modification methylase HaeIII [Haemophilus influenzae]